MQSSELFSAAPFWIVGTEHRAGEGDVLLCMTSTWSLQDSDHLKGWLSGGGGLWKGKTYANTPHV